MMNESELPVGNVEEKSIDSSIPEYAPLSPLRESGSESGKEESSSEGEKESGNDEHDVDNGNCGENENVEITDKDNNEVRRDCDVTEKPTPDSSDDNKCVKGYDSHSVKDKDIYEHKNESGSHENDVHNAKNEDSDSVEITDKQNEEVETESNVREKSSIAPSNYEECVKGVESDGPLDNETMTMKVQDKSDVVDGSSENVDRKVVGEITSVQAESELENHSDTSADESE